MNKTLPKTKKSWAARLLNPFVAIPLLILFLLLCAPFAYRGYKLSLVPDPGEPFDVAAFIKAAQVDDADNALFDFQKAISLRGARPNVDDWDQIFEELLSGKELSQETKDLIKFVEANEPALLVFEKGTLKPEYCEVPLDELDYESLLPVTQETRDFVRLMTARAILETRKGNFEEAANWYLACFRTARLVRQNGTIIHHLVAIAEYAIAGEDMIKGIQNKQFPRKVLEELREELSKINATFSPTSQSHKTESLMFEKLTKSDPAEISPFIGMGLAEAVPSSLFGTYLYIAGEPELSNRIMRQWLVNLLPEVDRPRYQRSPFIAGTNSLFLYNLNPKALKNKRQLSPLELDEVWMESNLFRFLSPAMAQYIDAEDRFQIRIQLLIAVLNLEIYRRKHGCYPAKLEDACPDGKVPVDIFDSAGAPLRYKKEADGSCKVWSVSFNAIDDGGTSMGFGNDDTDFGYHLGKQEEPQEEGSDDE